MRKRICFLAIIFCGLVGAQPAIVKVNTRNNSPNEVSIAIDPKNPQHMVAAANLTNVYHSKDGGLTWTEKNFKSSYGAYGDPVVIADGFGNFYLAHLALSRTVEKGKGFYAALDRIVIQKSIDGGETWSDGSACGYNPGKMQDKPWLSADKQGNIHVTWTEFDQYESKNPKDRSRIRFSKSTDGGLTFSEAITISDTTGDCLDDDNTLEGATTAIGANGEIYAAWAGFGLIYLDISIDGGKTWGRDSIVAFQQGGWSHQIPGFFRSNGMPFIKTDKAGRLYLLFGEQRHASALYDQMIGITFQLRMAEGNGQWKLLLILPGVMPNFCVDQITDKWYVHYYMPHTEVCHGKAGSSHFFTTAVVSPAFNKIDRQQISGVFALPPSRVFFGDYIDIAAYNNRVRPIWMQPDTNQMACFTSMTIPNYPISEYTPPHITSWGIICTSVKGHVVLLNFEKGVANSNTQFEIIDPEGHTVKTRKPILRKHGNMYNSYNSVTLKVKGLKNGVVYHLRVSNPEIKLPNLPFRVWE